MDAEEECNRYGNGNITAPKSISNLSKSDLISMYGSKYSTCECFWTPFTDQFKEGNFVNEYTRESLDR